MMLTLIELILITDVCSGNIAVSKGKARESMGGCDEDVTLSTFLFVVAYCSISYYCNNFVIVWRLCFTERRFMVMKLALLEALCYQIPIVPTRVHCMQEVARKVRWFT